jgi:hypothetical protein
LIDLPSASWFKVMRSEEALELFKDPPAFVLLALIAFRAQRTAKFNRHNLEPGEAFIGDHKACGLTQQEYRTAKSKLAEWGFATFKSTNKGTVAKLIDTRVFDINAETINKQVNSPSTSQQQTGNKPATTTKNGKNEKNAKNPNTPVASNLNQPLTPGGKRTVELMELCREIFGDDEINRFHKRWYDRAELHPRELRRALSETKNADTEGRITKGAPQYAEDVWKRFFGRSN